MISQKKYVYLQSIKTQKLQNNDKEIFSMGYCSINPFSIS